MINIANEVRECHALYKLRVVFPVWATISSRDFGFSEKGGLGVLRQVGSFQCGWKAGVDCHLQDDLQNFLARAADIHARIYACKQ